MSSFIRSLVRFKKERKLCRGFPISSSGYLPSAGTCAGETGETGEGGWLALSPVFE